MDTKLYAKVDFATTTFRNKVQPQITDRTYNIPSPGTPKVVNVTDSTINSALNLVCPRNTSKLIQDYIDHFNLLRSYIPFTSSPQSFRTAWGLRSQLLNPWDADTLINEGAQLIPVNKESMIFQTIQQGVEYGPNRRLILGVRHSEGNYEDELDDMGRFTYQPPNNVTGILRYRWCQYLGNILEIPYILLAIMWFKTHHAINDELNHVFIIAPVKIIEPDNDLDNLANNLAKPLTLQLISRNEALSTLNVLLALNETDIEIETRAPLPMNLAREWSYDKINNSEKGRTIKRWAQKTGKRCPGFGCKTGKPHIEFRDLTLSEIAFGHIISQNWSKAFTYLLDKVDHPDNLYLTCRSCNSSLQDSFPDSVLRSEIVQTGTIGDWIRKSENEIRKS